MLGNHLMAHQNAAMGGTSKMSNNSQNPMSLQNSKNLRSAKNPMAQMQP
jgi:hypothetical protein